MIATKTTSNGNRLFQVNGNGSWRSEYKTDSVLPIGTYVVIEAGVVIGKWIQGTLGHELILL